MSECSSIFNSSTSFSRLEYTPVSIWALGCYCCCYSHSPSVCILLMDRQWMALTTLRLFLSPLRHLSQHHLSSWSSWRPCLRTSLRCQYLQPTCKLEFHSMCTNWWMRQHSTMSITVSTSHRLPPNTPSMQSRSTQNWGYGMARLKYSTSSTKLQLLLSSATNSLTHSITLT